MIYELFEGFSGGFISAFESLEDPELNDLLEEKGVTIVYPSYGGRKIFIDDAVNKEEAEYYIKTHENAPADPDWRQLSKFDMIGYGKRHPYYTQKTKNDS